MSKKINQKNVTDNTLNGGSDTNCLICWEGDPDVLDGHHVFGRNNSPHKIPLCKSCHAPITYEQNKVSPKSRSKHASYLEQIGYQLVTVGALLREIGKQLIKLGHGLISYVEDCSSSLYTEAREN